jgi:hypothetical protein
LIRVLWRLAARIAGRVWAWITGVISAVWRWAIALLQSARDWMAGILRVIWRWAVRSLAALGSVVARPLRAACTEAGAHARALWVGVRVTLITLQVSLYQSVRTSWSWATRLAVNVRSSIAGHAR